MWNPLKREKSECAGVREGLEATAERSTKDADSDVGSLSAEQQDHLACCPDCQAAVDERLMSRFLLRGLPAVAAPDPWFAPRVMAAIAARESELRQSLETWTVLPRLAARLT